MTGDLVGVGLNLEDLARGGMSGLSVRMGGAMAEAAAVCLDDCGHGTPARLTVDGNERRVYDLVWRLADDQSRRTWADEQEATEQGACGIAILVVRSIRGHEVEQMDLCSDHEASAVIDEVLDLLQVVQEKDRDELARRIPEQPYLVNFNALARKIAPDGERVSMVGLTAHHPGRIRRVAFTRIRKELANFGLPGDPEERNVDASDRRITVRGVLHYANVIGREDTIKLEDQNGSVYEILVPEGMMTDIVHPLWDDEVVVTGIRRRKRIELEDIVPASEADNEFEEND